MSEALLPITIGDNISRVRIARGLSQPELADAMGVMQSYVSRIESGARPDMKASTVARFARALRCSPGDLYEGVEFPPSPNEVKRTRRRGRK